MKLPLPGPLPLPSPQPEEELLCKMPDLPGSTVLSRQPGDHKEIIKPRTDKLEYRHVALPNGIQVISRLVNLASLQHARCIHLPESQPSIRHVHQSVIWYFGGAGPRIATGPKEDGHSTWSLTPCIARPAWNLPDSLPGIQTKAIVVSDSETDKGAAAMDVQVGSFSDPEDIAGLAHFTGEPGCTCIPKAPVPAVMPWNGIDSFLPRPHSSPPFLRFPAAADPVGLVRCYPLHS